jgi:hypothetical protein
MAGIIIILSLSPGRRVSELCSLAIKRDFTSSVRPRNRWFDQRPRTDPHILYRKVIEQPINPGPLGTIEPVVLRGGELV